MSSNSVELEQLVPHEENHTHPHHHDHHDLQHYHQSASASREVHLDHNPARRPPKTQPPLCCPYLGLIFATLSSLFFSLCSVIVKSMTNVDPIALAAYRYLGVLLPAIPFVVYHNVAIFPRGKRILLILRSIIGTASLMLSFYAFRHMPLADASVIVFSVPVFTGIFAWLFLREPCGLFNVFSVILTLLGVVLITRPRFMFGTALTAPLGDDSDDGTDGGGGASAWGAVAAFSATLFGANAYVLLRALKTVHFAVIMVNFGTIALVQCTIASALFASNSGGGETVFCVPPCGTDRALIVALALFSFLGQILLTVALQCEQAGPVAIARSTDIVFAFVWQMMFFGELPNRYSVSGALLVLASVVLTGLRKWLIGAEHKTPPDGTRISGSSGDGGGGGDAVRGERGKLKRFLAILVK